MSEQISIVVGAFVVAFAWALLFFAVPRMLSSMFRYRLWRQRDELVDSLIRGDVPRTEPFVHLVRMLEHNIRNSDEVTLFRFVVVPRPPASFVREYNERITAAVKRMSPDHQRVYEDHRERYRLTIAKHLLGGSCYGWLVVTVLVVYFFVTIMAKRASVSFDQIRRVVADTSADRFVTPDRVVPMGANRDLTPLAAYA